MMYHTVTAQRNNYEILKMLLDRGASIPVPHDVKCGCDECVETSNDDSLRLVFLVFFPNLATWKSLNERDLV